MLCLLFCRVGTAHGRGRAPTSVSAYILLKVLTCRLPPHLPLASVQDDFVEVGMISRPHGVRGEVKVQLITDEPKKRLGTPGKR